MAGAAEGSALQSFHLPRIARKLMFRYWFLSRGVTLGVRAAIFDADDRIFLIKHSYVAGWHFPGGGVEAGEAVETSLARELEEEGNIVLTAKPTLFGLYHNPSIYPRDHVALYVARTFRQDEEPRPNHEIIDHGFFSRDALPPDITRSTRARLSEIAGESPVNLVW